MTPAEEAAVFAVIKQITEESMNQGIMAAVEMIRTGVQQFPDLTTLQLADAIEATVTKDVSRQS
jgi:hypothetical protein